MKSTMPKAANHLLIAIFQEFMLLSLHGGNLICTAHVILQDHTKVRK